MLLVGYQPPEFVECPLVPNPPDILYYTNHSCRRGCVATTAIEFVSINFLFLGDATTVIFLGDATTIIFSPSLVLLCPVNFDLFCETILDLAGLPLASYGGGLLLLPSLDCATRSHDPYSSFLVGAKNLSHSRK